MAYKVAEGKAENLLRNFLRLTNYMLELSSLRSQLEYWNNGMLEYWV